MGNLDIGYKASATFRKFHESNAQIRFVGGPIGSGKTVGCEIDVAVQMAQAPVQKDGVRRSKWAFIRDTTPNLKNTTMRTWLDWFPENVITQVRWGSPMEMRVAFDMPDRTRVESLIHCLYQSSAEDAENLKSLELTGIFFNEVNTIPIESVLMGMGRIGRYPSKRDLDGKPCRFSILGDTNMPDDEHWYYKMAEVIHPKGWAFFKQPPAMFHREGPDGKLIYYPNMGQKIREGILPAENIQNLNEGFDYYRKLCSGGASDDWIRVFVEAEYGNVAAGKPVYHNYSDRRHCVDAVIPFEKSKTLILGLDWGLTPSVAFLQMNEHGQVRMIDEVCGDDIGLERLWDTCLHSKLVNEYGWGSGTKIFVVGDPSNNRSEVNEDTCISFLIRKGINATRCRVIRPRDRIAAVDHFLTRTVHGGEPAFIISSKCKVARKGFAGRYFFKRMTQFSDEVYAGEPCKNSYSHIQDAIGYGCHALRFPDMYNVDYRAHNTSADPYRINLDAPDRVFDNVQSKNEGGLAGII